MTRAFVLLVLWFLQATVVLLLVNAEWVGQQARLEQASVAQHFGPSRYSQLDTRARAIYAEWFIETGIRAHSYARLLPDSTRPQHGMQGLAPWFFEWLKRRLDAFWWIVFQAICRVQVLREWLSLLLVVGCVSSLDGLVQRQIKRSSSALASADRYLLARHSLPCMLIAPLLYLSLPIAISPYVVPIWGACVAITLTLLTSHAQHRI